MKAILVTSDGQSVEAIDNQGHKYRMEWNHKRTPEEHVNYITRTLYEVYRWKYKRKRRSNEPQISYLKQGPNNTLIALVIDLEWIN